MRNDRSTPPCSELGCLIEESLVVYDHGGNERAFDLGRGDDLDRLRCISLNANFANAADIKTFDEGLYARLHLWLQHLVSVESSSRSFYLQHSRATDTTFYEQAPSPTDGESGGAAEARIPTLRPRRRPWPDGWEKKLGWMTHPEALTITELELALTIFDLQSEDKKPRLTWWLRKDSRPHILWRVHHILLKRYCFALLGPLRTAMENEGLNTPPFRAGEFWRWQPRMGGLTGIGVLAVVSLEGAVEFLFKADPEQVSLLTVGSFAVFLCLIWIDVFRQNRGVMASSGHAWRRVWSTAWRFAVWAAILSTLAGGMWCGFRPATSWVQVGRFALGIAGLAACSCLIGALLQWFWEDKAATEPM